MVVRAALTREADDKRGRYVLRVHSRMRTRARGGEAQRSGKGSLTSQQIVPFLDAVLPETVRGKDRQVRFCCEFAHPLTVRRPVFELPVALVGPGQDSDGERRAQIDGLMLSFPSAKSPLSELTIRVEKEAARLWLRPKGKARLALGDDPVRIIHDHAETIALAFTQEVGAG